MDYFDEFLDNTRRVLIFVYKKKQADILHVIYHLDLLLEYLQWANIHDGKTQKILEIRQEFALYNKEIIDLMECIRAGASFHQIGIWQDNIANSFQDVVTDIEESKEVHEILIAEGIMKIFIDLFDVEVYNEEDHSCEDGECKDYKMNYSNN